MADSKEVVLLKLQSGMHYMCVRRDDPNLPWLMDDPRIENSGVVQIDEQSSYIDFWWKGELSAAS